MKKSGVVSLALVVMFSVTNASAQRLPENSPVDRSHFQEVIEQNLTMIGRGVIDKTNQDTIGIACVDRECKQLRAVYFDHALQKTYFFGKTVPVLSDAKVAVKSYLHNYRNYIKNYGQETFFDNGGGDVLLIIAGSIAIVAGAPIIGSAVLVGSIVVFTSGGYPLAGRYSIREASLDQTGWNWAEGAKRVSHQRFLNYGNYINYRATLNF